jgi:hemerythrin-like domain-containing protein
MTAIENLENDHVQILRLIDVMELITKNPTANITHLETIVELIRNFADGLHHRKEENLLFPKMSEKGFSSEQGPVAVMLHEHLQGRGYVKGIAENIALYKEGNTSTLSAIYENMQGYIELLRAHISKENNILFRMADNALSDEEQQFLLNEFKMVENKLSDEYIRQIDRLAAAYKSAKV